MSSFSEDHWRRRGRLADLDDEMEEGEYVPGYHSASDTEEYYNNYSSSDSDETVSDARPYSIAPNNDDNASASSVAANGDASSSSTVAAPELVCRVCGKEFGSRRAVCGHMKVHVHQRPQGLQEQGNGRGEEVKCNGAVAGSWGVIGKRGCSGSRFRAISPNAEPDDSMAIVVAEPKLVLQSMPLAFTSINMSSVSMASARTDLSGEGSSAQPIHNDALAIVVAGANPPIEAVVHQQIAPPPLPAGEQAPLVHRPPAAGGQNPNGYTCSECSMWYRTHQGLGGHVAGHRNREIAAAAVGMPQDGAVPCRRGPNTEKRHVCEECGVDFPRGVQLGGHKRKHYTGPPIVPKKKQRIIQPLPPLADIAVPALDAADANMADLALPVKADVQSLAPAVEAEQPAPAPAAEGSPEPAPGPPVTGRVFLFGADIGPRAQTPTAQQGSPATEDPASTGGWL